MNRKLGLKLLGIVMEWDNARATEEFKWLSFMADYKYDGYRGYSAGARFIESLIIWLQQFDLQDREVAYKFVREQLIYFSPDEIERLVEKFVPETVQRHLAKQVADSIKIPEYKIWATSKSEQAYKTELRKTLFMGLSDGARIDVLRRLNSRVISNEQVVIATQIDTSKWKSLLKELREYPENEGNYGSAALFKTVYLVDDFTASGTSILPDPDIVGGLKGKLVRFLESVQEAVKAGTSPFPDSYKIYVHHYICTEEAHSRIRKVYRKVKRCLAQKYKAGEIEFSFGMLLPGSIAIKKNSSDPFAELCEKYYDKSIEGKGKHGSQSGITDRHYGYASCGLPVVLEHNTPNNSLSILHSRTDSDNDQHNMRPLFYRRERHSDLEQDIISDYGGTGDD